MAKPARQVNVRLATTINARFYSTDSISDGFFLDGRFPGKREVRSADSMLDREDRSFFSAIYGRPEGDDESWQESLTRFHESSKAGTQTIDEECNVMADVALEVAGQAAAGEDERGAYFASFIIQDGEASAVTIGDGGAYLYRKDLIYALTNDDFPLEPIDLNGNPVDISGVFAAGSAGALRYANILNLEQNDSLILCNRAVLAAVGQREFMRILNEADDANEAAGLIITAAQAKSPGVPMQLVIAFVNYVTPLDNRGRLNLGRFATGVMSAQSIRDAAEIDENAKTQQFSRKELDAFSAPAAPQNDRLADFKPPTEERRTPTSIDDLYGDGAPKPTLSDTDRYSRMASASFGSVAENDLPDDDGAIDYANKRGRRTAGDVPAAREGYAAASQRYQPRSSQRGSGLDELPVSKGKRHRLGGARPEDDSYDFDEINDIDETDDRNKVKRIIFYALLFVIIGLSLFALIRLLVKTSDTAPSETVTPTTLPQVSQTAPPVVQPTETTEGQETEEDEVTQTVAPTTETPQETQDDTAPEGSVKHTVAAGESWWSLAEEYYGEANMELCELIAQANGFTASDGLHEGQILLIPQRD